MKCGFSSNAFTKFSIFDAIQSISKIGYDGIEIVLDSPHAFLPLHDIEIKKIKNSLQKHNLCVTNLNSNTVSGFSSIENPFEPSLSNNNEKLRNEVLKITGAKNYVVKNGPYGYYIKYGTINYGLPKSLKENKIEKMDLKEALEYLAGKGDENVIKGIIHKSKLILVKKGPYGNYIQTTFKGKKMNIKLGEEIPEDEEIIEKVMKKLKKNTEENF